MGHIGNGSWSYGMSNLEVSHEESLPHKVRHEAWYVMNGCVYHSLILCGRLDGGLGPRIDKTLFKDVLIWIERLAVHFDHIVQVRTRCQAGASHKAYHVAAIHSLTFFNQGFSQVAV
jgi:hypothetical protein